MKKDAMNERFEAFPSSDAWGKMYAKFFKDLMLKLNHIYCRCQADREDAIEQAFDKLMNRKKPEAYGGKMPDSEKGWFWALYWQARSYLSHMKEHADVHAKYVKSIFEESHGRGGGVESAALWAALDFLRKEHGVSRRNLEVYIDAALRRISSKNLEKKYGITESNVNVIKFRIGKLLAKYGKKYYQVALKRVA